MLFTLQYIAALLIDGLFGDPQAIPHPVRGIGWLCNRFEAGTRRWWRNLHTAGTVAFLAVLVSTLLVPALLLLFLHRVSPIAEGGVAILLLSTSIACRDLAHHSAQVQAALTVNGDIAGARAAVARIVGRDTSQLDGEGICRAAVETVAENLVDGVLSPLIYAILASCLEGGRLLAPVSLAVLGAYGYKAINTMDSMYGYKNERYIEFGRTAARVDDLANFVPARLGGLLLVAAAWFLGRDSRGAWRILKRDRLQHASPNGGHPEAAVAGALGIRLGGNSHYFGKVVEKPTMGDATRPLEPVDIRDANRLMYGATLLGCALLLVGRMLLTR